mmetsp:Transcript_95472/g.143030  ORF Transcript_95472/g.143030 Transcript_95472/m.143030 type:complete len:90 (+) Transcript_95472:305-574(+)
MLVKYFCSVSTRYIFDCIILVMCCSVQVMAGSGDWKVVSAGKGMTSSWMAQKWGEEGYGCSMENLWSPVFASSATVGASFVVGIIRYGT